MAATWDYAPDSDDDEVEEGAGENKGFYAAKSVLILLVDSTPEMFKPWKDSDVPFRAAIKCCQAILRRKVIADAGKGNNLVSILFVGTKEAKNPPDFENIYQLNELSPVKVNMIEKLNAMKDSEDFDGFKEKIGSSADYDMKDVFWIAKMIIDDKNAANFQKRFIFFTKNDAPPGNMDEDTVTELVRKFKDIGRVSMSIVAFNDEFEWDTFYSRIGGDTSLVIAENLEHVMKTIRLKEKGRRPISKATFEIAPGLKMGVGFYTLARSVLPPKPVKVNKRTNEELSKTVNEFRADSGMPVLKSEERKMITVQGEKAIFTKEEMQQVKQVHERGLTLLGFLSRDEFDPFAWYRSSGYFLYPDNDQINGSETLFAALLKRCFSLKKIILVKMVLSRGRSPKLACLIPSLNDPVCPQGFHVFPVPFCDEIRQYDFELSEESNQLLVSLMEKVIKKVTNKGFDPLDVFNPAIQYRWRELERMALDISEDDQGEFSDFTEPNVDLITERLGDLPNQIDSITGAFAGQKSTAPVTKFDGDMAIEVRNGRVEKLTVPILRDYLHSVGIETTRMRKADLVNAVYKHLKV